MKFSHSGEIILAKRQRGLVQAVRCELGKQTSGMEALAETTSDAVHPQMQTQRQPSAVKANESNGV